MVQQDELKKSEPLSIDEITTILAETNVRLERLIDGFIFFIDKYNQQIDTILEQLLKDRATGIKAIDTYKKISQAPRVVLDDYRTKQRELEESFKGLVQFVNSSLIERVSQLESSKSKVLKKKYKDYSL